MPLTYVQGSINVATGPIVIAAYAGAPFFSALIGAQVVQTGSHGFSFGGAGIVSLVVMGNPPVTNLQGVDANGAANDPAWQKLEVVGLPVEPPEWAGVFGWPNSQGMNVALVSPVDAALDRYRRGAPYFGWDDLIQPARPAPPWVDADPKAIIQTLQTDMMDDLRKMISTLPPDQHITYRVEQPVALSGNSTHTATTSFSPISTLMLGVASDTLASLIAGFGTAYPHARSPAGVADFGNVSPFDFMVTATFAKGLDAKSPEAEYAAIVCAPGPAPLPPTPANLSPPLDGLAARHRRYPLARADPDHVGSGAPSDAVPGRRLRRWPLWRHPEPPDRTANAPAQIRPGQGVAADQRHHQSASRRRHRTVARVR